MTKTVTTFGNWLSETKCNKRFCEWNGRVYFVAEIIAGRFSQETAADLSDVPS